MVKQPDDEKLQQIKEEHESIAEQLGEAEVLDVQAEEPEDPDIQDLIKQYLEEAQQETRLLEQPNAPSPDLLDGLGEVRVPEPQQLDLPPATTMAFEPVAEPPRPRRDDEPLEVKSVSRPDISIDKTERPAQQPVEAKPLPDAAALPQVSALEMDGPAQPRTEVAPLPDAPHIPELEASFQEDVLRPDQKPLSMPQAQRQSVAIRDSVPPSPKRMQPDLLADGQNIVDTPGALREPPTIMQVAQNTPGKPWPQEEEWQIDNEVMSGVRPEPEQPEQPAPVKAALDFGAEFFASLRPEHRISEEVEPVSPPAPTTSKVEPPRQQKSRPPQKPVEPSPKPAPEEADFSIENEVMTSPPAPEPTGGEQGGGIAEAARTLMEAAQAMLAAAAELKGGARTGGVPDIPPISPGGKGDDSSDALMASFQELGITSAQVDAFMSQEATEESNATKTMLSRLGDSLGGVAGYIADLESRMDDLEAALMRAR